MIVLWLRWHHIVWIQILFWIYVLLFPQFMITLIANSLSINILLGCFFFCSSASLYVCFLWSEKYFTVVIPKLLRSYPSSIFFSFNYNIPSLSTIVSTAFLIPFSPCINNAKLVCSAAFLAFLIFSFILLYYVNTFFTEENLSWLIYKSFKALEIKTSGIFNLVFANNSMLLSLLSFFLGDLLTLFNYCSDCTNV